MTVKIEDLGQTIKEIRKLAGLTQKELAELAGLGKTLIFDIEHGATSVSIENLLKILQVLNIKVELKTPIELKD
jgi:y4mF family transcriptional regulator